MPYNLMQKMLQSSNILDTDGDDLFKRLESLQKYQLNVIQLAQS